MIVYTAFNMASRYYCSLIELGPLRKDVTWLVMAEAGMLP